MALLILYRQLENPLAHLLGVLVEYKILDLRRVSLPTAVVLHVVLGIEHPELPLGDRAFGAVVELRQRAWFRFVEEIHFDASVVIRQVLLVHGHNLHLGFGVNHIEVRQRNVGFHRRRLELLAIQEAFSDILGHFTDVVVGGGNETVVLAEPQAQRMAFAVALGIMYNMPVFSIGQIEDLVLVHSVDAVGIGLIGLVRNLRIAVFRRQIDEVLLLRSLVVLNRFQGVKGTRVVAHLQVEEVHHGQSTAIMALVASDGAEPVEAGVVERLVAQQRHDLARVFVRIVRLILNRHLILRKLDS